MDRKSCFRHTLQTAKHPNLLQILRRYPNMVMRSAQAYLQKPDFSVDWVSVAAQTGDSHQGLIVAFLNPRRDMLQIVSWCIVPKCSNQGLGQRLLAELEVWCRKQGVKRMTFDLRNGNVSYDVASHIMRKQGWGDQQPLVHRFKVAASTLTGLGWEKHQCRSTRIKTFPWKTLSERQRSQLLNASRNDEQFPAELLPFNSEQGIEYTVSLGLCHGNEVIGWVVAHRQRRDLIEYSTLYVKPSCRLIGAAILLLGESFRLLADTEAESVIFQVRVDNHMMLRFARKRCQPILSEATLFRAEKVLVTG